MEPFSLLMLGVYGIFISEFLVLLWFLKRKADLDQGNTYFKISRKIPIFYLIATSLVVAMIISAGQNPFGELLLPRSSIESQAISFFLLANLTTPLFPILESMKRRKIQEIMLTTQDDD